MSLRERWKKINFVLNFENATDGKIPNQSWAKWAPDGSVP